MSNNFAVIHDHGHHLYLGSVAQGLVVGVSMGISWIDPNGNTLARLLYVGLAAVVTATLYRLSNEVLDRVFGRRHKKP